MSERTHSELIIYAYKEGNITPTSQSEKEKVGNLVKQDLLEPDSDSKIGVSQYKVSQWGTYLLSEYQKKDIPPKGLIKLNDQEIKYLVNHHMPPEVL